MCDLLKCVIFGRSQKRNNVMVGHTTSWEKKLLIHNTIPMMSRRDWLTCKVSYEVGEHRGSVVSKIDSMVDIAMDTNMCRQGSFSAGHTIEAHEW